MKRYLLIPLALFLFIACTKTITPTLTQAPTQVAIQGAVSDSAGPYYVLITSSVSFYASNTYPGISGAAITITDSTTGMKDALTETNTAGRYVTHSLIQGIPGHTYLLNVSLNGQTYTASSTMPQPVLLDSISFVTNDTTRYQAQANFQDPKGIVNFYKYSMILNGVPDGRFQSVEDRLSDGKYIHDKVDADTAELKPGYNVELCLVGIDKNVYTYLHEAENIAYNNGSLAGPANPVSNISGGCLGYFSAQTVSSKTKVLTLH